MAEIRGYDLCFSLFFFGVRSLGNFFPSNLFFVSSAGRYPASFYVSSSFEQPEGSSHITTVSIYHFETR